MSPVYCRELGVFSTYQESADGAYHLCLEPLWNASLTLLCTGAFHLEYVHDGEEKFEILEEEESLVSIRYLFIREILKARRNNNRRL